MLYCHSDEFISSSGSGWNGEKKDEREKKNEKKENSRQKLKCVKTLSADKNFRNCEINFFSFDDKKKIDHEIDLFMHFF